MKTTPVTLILALLVAAAPAAAQQLTDSRFQRATIPATAALVAPMPVAAATAAPTLDPAERAPAADASVADDGGFSFRPILHTLGGALVGGWLGYVGAQVAKSDWDKETNGTFAEQRTTWVAAGAAVGVLGSWLIGETRAPRPGGPLAPRPSPRDRTMITTREIRDSGHHNALDVIRSLRSEWLQTRGTNSWGESPRGTMDGFGDTFESQIVQTRDKIVVYLNDIRIGGVDDLAGIAADELTSIRFLDARRATYLYGNGHSHGAIILSTEPDMP